MFLGKNGFVWWIGVVEDNVDPINLCRAKVRIFGYHPEFSSNKVPTSDLPWAITIMSMNVPDSYNRPALGEWVFGFFLDGEEAQEPAIVGYIPGIVAGALRANPTSFGRYNSSVRSFSKVSNNTRDNFVMHRANTVVSVANTGIFSVNASNSIFLDTSTGVINIRRGSSVIEMSANGDVRIVANNISISSSNNLSLGASNTINIAASRVNVGTVATANVSIRGQRVDLN